MFRDEPQAKILVHTGAGSNHNVVLVEINVLRHTTSAKHLRSPSLVVHHEQNTAKNKNGDSTYPALSAGGCPSIITERYIHRF